MFERGSPCLVKDSVKYTRIYKLELGSQSLVKYSAR